MAATMPDVVAEIAALLGMDTLDETTIPTYNQVARWVLTAQEDLSLRAPPDVLVELWREERPSDDPMPIFPGTRIISVSVAWVPAKQIPAREAEIAALGTGSLFGGTGRSPKWWISAAAQVGGGFLPVLLTAPTADTLVVYVRPPDVPTSPTKPALDAALLLGPHLRPLLVRYGYARALQADEAPEAGQAMQDYENALQQLLALHMGRLDAWSPGEKDTSARRPPRAPEVGP